MGTEHNNAVEKGGKNENIGKNMQADQNFLMPKISPNTTFWSKVFMPLDMFEP